jgi:hypothetical protein
MKYCNLKSWTRRNNNAPSYQLFILSLLPRVRLICVSVPKTVISVTNIIFILLRDVPLVGKLFYYNAKQQSNNFNMHAHNNIPAIFTLHLPLRRCRFYTLPETH